MTHPTTIRNAVLCGALLCMAAAPAHAEPLHQSERAKLDLSLEAGAGAFHSQRNYAQSGTLAEGESSWQEGFVKLGLGGHRLLQEDSRVYAGVSAVSQATFGDGDPAGWTNSSERRTLLSEAYAGWRSGKLFPALGEDGLEVSFGRQALTVGDGFLLSGDAISFGNEIAGGSLNRGGAYYLAPNKSFARTAVLRLGGSQGLRSDLIWLKSSNPAHGMPEMAVATLEHVAPRGTVGLTFTKVLDTDPLYDIRARKGVKTGSLRAQGNVGVEGLFLSGEYAHQDKPTGNARAWYGEAGWTFSGAPWTPSVNYRYSYFSPQYDPMFYGTVRGLGTWFQGEVAANFAGPYNNNARVHHLESRMKVSDNLSFGILANRFRSIERSGILHDAWEVDVFAEWMAGPVYVMPLIGYYKPKFDVASGGTQIGNRRANVYGQLIVAVRF
ncbi:hypothetical protein ACWV27_26695 (plasmid) [Massilia varians]